MILYSANQFWRKKRHKGDFLSVLKKTKMSAQNSGGSFGVGPILDGSLISSGLHPTRCSCSSGECSFVNDSFVYK